MSDNKKQPIATEIYNGYPCFIMPSEPDPEAERWVFVPKVRITGNLTINPDDTERKGVGDEGQAKVYNRGYRFICCDCFGSTC